MVARRKYVTSEESDALYKKFAASRKAALEAAKRKAVSEYDAKLKALGAGSNSPYTDIKRRRRELSNLEKQMRDRYEKYKQVQESMRVDASRLGSPQMARSVKGELLSSYALFQKIIKPVHHEDHDKIQPAHIPASTGSEPDLTAAGGSPNGEHESPFEEGANLPLNGENQRQANTIPAPPKPNGQQADTDSQPDGEDASKPFGWLHRN